MSLCKILNAATGVEIVAVMIYHNGEPPCDTIIFDRDTIYNLEEKDLIKVKILCGSYCLREFKDVSTDIYRAFIEETQDMQSHQSVTDLILALEEAYGQVLCTVENYMYDMYGKHDEHIRWELTLSFCNVKSI